MEVRHYMETRDELARQIAEFLSPRKTGRVGGGLSSAETEKVAVRCTLQGNTAHDSMVNVAEMSLEYATLALPSADVILWKPSIFDAATYNRGEKAGERVPLSILPTTLQLWLPDDDGRSDVWRHLERDMCEHLTKNNISPLPVKLIGVITGLIPYDFFNAAPGSPYQIGTTGKDASKDARHAFSSRGYDTTLEHSPLCTAVFVYREKVGAKKFRFSLTTLLADRVVCQSEQDTIVYSCLQFMAQQYVSRDLVGYDRRPTARRPLHKPAHRSSVARMVLRERVIEPVGKLTPADGAATAGGAQEGKEWDKCWLVRPHTRTLAKPRKKDGAQTIPVRSHVKGNKQAPLLDPRDRLIQVVR